MARSIWIGGVQHLLAAKCEGKSLTQYARSHGLSRYTLYAALQMLRSAGVRPSVERRPRAVNKAAPQLAFAAVKLVAPSNFSGRSVPQLRAHLPKQGEAGSDVG